MTNDLKKYNTLFLDRDGVINVERKDDYVKNVSEFVFEDNACEAIAILSRIFSRIFIVTNQRGVGRGIMSGQELADIHSYMLDEINSKGGNITKIYTCFDTDTDSVNRKPNVGMAFKAQGDFPDIDFKTSVLVGNSRSDIEFATKLDMYSVLVGDKYDKTDKIYKNINAYYPNLYQFALSLYSLYRNNGIQTELNNKSIQ